MEKVNSSIYNFGSGNGSGCGSRFYSGYGDYPNKCFSFIHSSGSKVYDGSGSGFGSGAGDGSGFGFGFGYIHISEEGHGDGSGDGFGYINSSGNG